MTELQEHFKIANGGILNKHIEVDCEWGIQSYGKIFVKVQWTRRFQLLLESMEIMLVEKLKYESFQAKT